MEIEDIIHSLDMDSVSKEMEDIIHSLDMDSVSKNDQKDFEGIDISYSFVARKSYI
jgi:hypothetical protein